MKPSKERSPLRGPSTILALFFVSALSFWLGRLSVEQEYERLRKEMLQERSPRIEAPTKASEGQEAAEPPILPPTSEVEAPTVEEAPEEEAPTLAAGTLYDLSLSIRGSVTRTLQEAVGKKVGDPLAQVAGRLLVWWVDLSRDLRRGDDLRLVYELPEGAEPVIHALSFTSQKLGRTFEAFRFQAQASDFARYYDREGREIELRLERSPIERYEQITSLLRDGRGHAGVDFKAPVGVPVVAPWAGVVKRTNFNQRINGRCVEIEDAKGRRFLFLHLSELAEEMRPGAKVARGQLVGFSGNTGRSTAPHLHYQIMSKAGRVLDPMKEHPTYRLSLKPAHLPAFRQVVERYERRLQLAATQ